jgi:hypothetical protein
LGDPKGEAVYIQPIYLEISSHLDLRALAVASASSLVRGESGAACFFGGGLRENGYFSIS